MSHWTAERLSITDADLNFVVEQAAPDFSDKDKLKRLMHEDEAFRKGLIGNEQVFKKLTEAREEMLPQVSPALYFEVLLRRAAKELEKASYTVEKTGSETVAVFDARTVADLLAKPQVLEYLVDMLVSFTRIENYVIPVRVRPGIWRRIRFNDMDSDSLGRFSQAVDEEHRFGFYKRLADVCLFILGMFPDHAHQPHSPSSPVRSRQSKRTAQDYTEEGKRFYRLASEHPSSRALNLSEVLWLLHDNFTTATKPLSFISAHFLHSRRRHLFPMDAE